MPSPPAGALAFVKRWIRLFHARDWKKLHALEHPDFDDGTPPGVDHDFVEELGEDGYRVTAHALKPYEQPAWSIFRTYALEPRPTWWCDLTMTDASGHRVESFLALAPWERDTFRNAYYVSRPKKKRVGALDLRRERAKVASLVTKAVRRFEKEVCVDVELLSVALGTDDGTLAVSFDVDDAEPGRVMSHGSFEELLVPRWADVQEHGAPVIDLGGTELRANGDGTWGPKRRAKRFEELVGHMVVDVLLELRDGGKLVPLGASTTAEIGAEDLSGWFGWPRHEDRGKKNRLVPRSKRR